MRKSAVEQLELGLITEAEARVLAAVERAAIRAAGPLYVSKGAPTKAEAEARAEAEAATTGTDTTGKLALGAIVEQETAEAKQQAAEARRAAGIAARRARAELPARAIEWHPAPVRKLTEAELAQQAAEQRWNASIARQLAAVERAEARQAEQRQARRAAVAGNAASMFAELAGSPAELEQAARKARATGKLAAARARAAFLAESGMTEEQARAEELLAESFELAHWAAPDAIATRKPKADAGMDSRLSPAELAAVAEWTEAGLASPAARAGRQALEAIGPVASGMILTSVKARKLTVAKVCRVPKVETAEARAGKAEAALEAARARLAEAEAALAAVEATGAVPAIRKAEAEANRVAEIVHKAAARASKAAMTLAEARKLAGRPASDGWVYLPVESFKLAEAGKAADIELAKRSDRMPARYADRGPQAKGKAAMNDNTARLALAELDRLTEAEQARYWAETWDMITELLEAKRAAEQAEAEAAAEASKAARRAYKAAHERNRRAKQHSKR